MPSATDLQALQSGRHPDPYAVLGAHARDGQHTVTAFLPGDLLKVALAALITQGIARMRPDALLSRG